MSKTVTLHYGDMSKDYMVGNTERTCENRVVFLKKIFAKDFVIRKWFNAGKLSKENFGPSLPGTFGTLKEDSLSEDELAAFRSEVNTVVNSVEITYNRAV